MSSMIQTLKKKAELARVTAARYEMEVKLCELKSSIERVMHEIEIQTTKETELLSELAKQGE